MNNLNKLKWLANVGAIIVASLFLTNTVQAQPKKPECIAPAKPGGGFDLTCRIAAESLDKSGLLKKNMTVTFMPGGVGAVAISQMTSSKRKNGNIITAFSTGSLLNIASGKFGKSITADSVRWLATIGADYGAIIVLKDSPFKSLNDLADAIKVDPTSVAFGAGGSVGSQDWTKAALLFKELKSDPKKMRYLAYEGGGEAFASLLGKHIDVAIGDVSEVIEHLKGGDFRVLAILSDKRLEELEGVPTATEQGYKIEWPIIRGFYMGPEVSDADYNFYLDAFKKLYESDSFKKARSDRGLLPFNMAGEEASVYIKEQINKYKELSKEFGIN